MIRLEFLGKLADLAGAPLCEIDHAGPLGLADLIAAAALPPALAVALAEPRVRLALNGALVAPASLTATAGDVIAFLPPVSGG